MTRFTREPTEFLADGTILRGYAYVPTANSAPQPAVVMSHGWGATLRMGLEPYAERFAEAGFAVLLYDNPNIGLSDGEPRFEINPWVRARATRDAVTHASALPGFDSERVAIWGDSGDAARVFLNAAVDDRVKAVIAYNPTFGSTVPEEPPDVSVVERVRHVMDAPKLPPRMQSTHGPALVVSADPNVESMSPSPQAFRWFCDYGGRHGSGWENRWSYAINETQAPFSPYDCLPAVSIPVLLVKGRDDEIPWCDPATQRNALAQVTGPARWHEVDHGHFGALYTDGPVFAEAVRVQIDFLNEVFLHQS
jgi:pimeloyl-ACP methyl ester carboxylesterase